LSLKALSPFSGFALWAADDGNASFPDNAFSDGMWQEVGLTSRVIAPEGAGLHCPAEPTVTVETFGAGFPLKMASAVDCTAEAVPPGIEVWIAPAWMCEKKHTISYIQNLKKKRFWSIIGYLIEHLRGVVGFK
jgi:hypothetical protein